MDRASLLKIHQDMLNHKHNNDVHMEKIVQTLGGIDQILIDYLKHSEMTLPSKIINKLHKIITSNPNKILTTNDNIELNDTVVLYLESNNNYLYSLLEQTHYNKILAYIHHKFAEILIILTWILWFVFVAAKNQLLWSIYVIIISLLLWIPYCSFWVLSVNTKAFRKILKSFDFWIKLSYLVLWGILELIHRFILQRNAVEYPVLSFIAYLFFDMASFLGLVIISSFDGFETKKNWTIIISGIVALITLMYSIYYQFNRISNHDDSIVILFTYQFSLRAIMANAQRVIGIFLAKQTFNLIKNKQKATSIYMKPILIWTNKLDKQRTNTISNHADNHQVEIEAAADIHTFDIKEESMESFDAKNIRVMSFTQQKTQVSEIDIYSDNGNNP